MTVSNNLQNLHELEKKLQEELALLKSNTPNWLWEFILKLISLGNIDLTDQKQKSIHTIYQKLQQVKVDSKNIQELELRLESFQKGFYNLYINQYKQLKLQTELLNILNLLPLYDLSIEKEKFHFLSNFIINPEQSVHNRNKEFIEEEKENYHYFFQTVEANPLTQNQQNAVITNENSNLVIAGAGSGKTSVVVAKVGYIIKQGLANPEDILILAFNKKAVEEIKDRIASTLNIQTNISTFHSFGLNVIGSASKKPMICSWATDDKELTKLLRGIIEEKLHSAPFFKMFKKYFLEHFIPYKNEFDFNNHGEYYNYIKNYDLRSLNGDRVKSYEECEISNYLSLKKVRFFYEYPYEYETATSQYRQYQPDFYLPDYGIYIEHFGISREKKTAPHIDSEKYIADMEWKRALHKQYETKLIETYSYEKSEGNLLPLLEKKLLTYNVLLEDISFEEAIQIFNAKNGAVDQFTKLLIQFLNHFKNNQYQMDALKKKVHLLDFRTKAFLDIFEIVSNEYEVRKQSAHCIDFYDMINDAVSLIKQGRYKSQFKYILVDEFQDISSARSRLVHALFSQVDDCILTVVGDDWQSINRFAGSDVSIIKNFSTYFGRSETIFLDNTFRFDNNISNVASKFIMKNPSQITKSIQTVKQSNNPSIYIYQNSPNETRYIERILSFLDKKTTDDTKKSVLILARFHHLKPDNFYQIQNRFQKFTIDFLSIHGSKGLGADYVILLGLDKGKFGFPCEIEDDPILDIVMSQQENYKFAEERRLFYVALTRTKEKLFIVSNIHEKSEFVQEIIEENSENEVQYLNSRDYIPQYCPSCKLGSLVERNGTSGPFHGCSNYPLCEYTQEIRKCPKCQSNLAKDTAQFIAICENIQCTHSEVLCKKCLSFMNVRKKDNREFLGCTNYFKTGCTYTQVL